MQLDSRYTVRANEWKVKKCGTNGKCRVWSKLHLAVDTYTHEIIAAELTLSGVTDAEVLSNYSNKHAEPSRRFREMAHTIQGSTTR